MGGRHLLQRRCGMRFSTMPLHRHGHLSAAGSLSGAVARNVPIRRDAPLVYPWKRPQKQAAAGHAAEDAVRVTESANKFQWVQKEMCPCWPCGQRRASLRAQQLQHAPAVRLEVRGHALRRALKARQQRLPARLQRLLARLGAVRSHDTVHHVLDTCLHVMHEQRSSCQWGVNASARLQPSVHAGS